MVLMEVEIPSLPGPRRVAIGIRFYQFAGVNSDFVDASHTGREFARN
jgi:hypothetical protein